MTIDDETRITADELATLTRPLIEELLRRFPRAEVERRVNAALRAAGVEGTFAFTDSPEPS